METAPNGVEFRDVDGFLGYRVGADGSVWSCVGRQALKGFGSGCKRVLTDKWRKLRPIVSSRGYLWVNLWLNCKQKSIRIHQLVAQAFIGPYPSGKQVNHIDGDKRNNKVTNLEYVTAKENIAHSIRTGLRKNFRKGESNPQARFTEQQVREVLSLEGSMAQRAIALRVGIPFKQVNNILRGRTWRHITGR